MARTIRSIHAKKARQTVRRPSASTGRNPGTGNRRTKRQAQPKRAAGIQAKSRRYTGSRIAEVTAGRFRHGTAGVSTPEAEKQPAGHSGWMNASPR
jgi:hypothetical protein